MNKARPWDPVCSYHGSCDMTVCHIVGFQLHISDDLFLGRFLPFPF